MSKRESLLKQKTLDVTLPSGETVKIRGLKRGEIVDLHNAPGTDADKAQALAKRCITHCLLNDDESRMFGDGEEPLVDQLDAGDSGAIVTAVQKLSGLVHDDSKKKA